MEVESVLYTLSLPDGEAWVVHRVRGDGSSFYATVHSAGLLGPIYSDSVAEARLAFNEFLAAYEDGYDQGYSDGTLGLEYDDPRKDDDTREGYADGYVDSTNAELDFCTNCDEWTPVEYSGDMAECQKCKTTWSWSDAIRRRNLAPHHSANRLARNMTPDEAIELEGTDVDVSVQLDPNRDQWERNYHVIKLIDDDHVRLVGPSGTKFTFPLEQVWTEEGFQAIPKGRAPAKIDPYEHLDRAASQQARCPVCGEMGLVSTQGWNSWLICPNGHASEVGDDLSDLAGTDDRTAAVRRSEEDPQYDAIHKIDENNFEVIRDGEVIGRVYRGGQSGTDPATGDKTLQRGWGYTTADGSPEFGFRTRQEAAQSLGNLVNVRLPYRNASYYRPLDIVELEPGQWWFVEFQELGMGASEYEDEEPDPEWDTEWGDAIARTGPFPTAEAASDDFQSFYGNPGGWNEISNDRLTPEEKARYEGLKVRPRFR